MSSYKIACPWHLSKILLIESPPSYYCNHSTLCWIFKFSGLNIFFEKLRVHYLIDAFFKFSISILTAKFDKSLFDWQFQDI